MNTIVHPRHTTARTAREHAAIGRRFAPSALEWFPVLRQRLLDSRPVIDVVGGKLVHGAPTFRNRLVGGEHQ